jgi:putative IMPACT (imprinted ancient) family translation regulator
MNEYGIRGTVTGLKSRHIAHWLQFGVVILALMMALVAHGSDYYIATTGDDDDPGTAAEPWATIAKANSTLTAGDTVYIKVGTYTDRIYPNNSGTSGNPITYKRYQNDSVTIDASETARLIGRSYVIIDGFTLDAENGGCWVNLRGTSTYNTIQNCTMVHDGTATEWAGVYLQDGASYNRILNNSLSSDSIGDLIYIKDDSNYNLIQGNTLTGGAHNSIDIQSAYGLVHHNVVRNNVIKNRWHTGLNVYSDTEYTIIEGNLIYGCGEDHEDNTYGSEGDRSLAREFHPGLQHGAKYSIVRNNTFVNNGTGIGLSRVGDGTADQYGRIYNNSFHQNYFAVYSNSATCVRGVTLKNNSLVKSRLKELRIAGTTASIFYVNNNIFDAPIDKGADTFVSVFEAEANAPTVWFDNLALDPKYVRPSGNDLRLRANSPLIDAGAFLTKASGSGTNSTSLVVDDARYFTDGYGIITGDTIQLENQTQTATISAINYSTNTLTLSTALTWSDDQGVALAYSDDSPDVGADEVDIDLTNGLEGHWPLNESSGTTAADASGNGNHGTLSGGPIWQSTGGKIDGALQFDGTNDVVNIPAIDFEAPITYCAWIKPDTDSGTHSALGRYYGGYRLGMQSGLHSFNLYIVPGTVHGKYSGDVAASEWVHLAATYDGATYTCYINGEPVEVTTLTGALAKTDKAWQIGANGNNNEYFDGLVDDVRLYSRALSPAEVETLAQRTDPGGLAAHWKLDESSGITALDASGNGNHGTLVNGPSWRSGDGKVDGGLEFDGTNDVVNISAIDFNYPITYSAWIRPTDLSGLQCGMGRNSGGYRLGIQGATYSFNMYIDSSNNVSDLGSTVSGLWTHVAATYDGSSLIYYINGVAVETNSVTDNLSETDEVWQLGANGNSSNYFKGFLDEVRIYNRVLDATAIAELASTESIPGLMAHWKLDEQTGATTAVDSSGNGNHGILSGGTWSPTGGRIGGALQFDGTDDVVNISAISFNYPITYSAWIKPTTTSGSHAALGRYYGGYKLGTASTSFSYNIYTSANNSRTSDTVTANEWAHLAATYDGTTITYYLNGVSVATVAQTADLSQTSSAWQIGAHGHSNEYFQGYVDDVRLYSRVLTSTEIASIADPIEVPEGLRAYWRLDEGESDTAAIDSSGRGNDADLVGDAVFAPTSGVKGGALSLDGTGDRADAPAITFNYPITYCAWIKPDTVSGTHIALGRYYGGYRLGTSGAAFSFNLYTETTPNNHVETLGTAVASTWTHVTATYDGTSLKYYINGIAVKTLSIASDLKKTDAIWQIGAHGSSNDYFEGLIDEVRIYDRVLTLTEIGLLADDND